MGVVTSLAENKLMLLMSAHELISYLHMVSSKNDACALISQCQRHNGLTLHCLGCLVQQYVCEEPFRNTQAHIMNTHIMTTVYAYAHIHSSVHSRVCPKPLLVQKVWRKTGFSIKRVSVCTCIPFIEDLQ